MQLVLAISPVIVIFLLMTVGKRSADMAGLIGWIYTSLIAMLFFRTGLEVVLLASLAGVVASFPISLMVVTSIFQINVMEEANAIRRLVVFMKTLASENRAVQIMLINVGIGTLLASLGATPVSILPPIMLSLGYSAFIAVALPAIGYDALCTYALLGVPVVVFADVASSLLGQDLSPADVGMFFAQYMPLVTTMISLSMLWLVGRWPEVKRSWPVALITGLTAGFIAIGMNYVGLPTLTGVVAGIGVVVVMLLYLKVSGKKLIDRSKLSEADHTEEKSMKLGLAVLPWILLVAFSILTNYKALGVYDLLFSQWGMPVTIIPDKPQLLRASWHAYTWVLIATLIAMPFYRMTKAQISQVLAKTGKRVPRPAFAAAIFFAIAFVLNHSGKSAVAGGWTMADGGSNMVAVMATSCASVFQQSYSGVAAFLGLLGGFISGSETSSIVMLTKLHFDTVVSLSGTANSLSDLTPGSELQQLALLIAAVSGIGGGLASVISPAKLQNAAAVIDKIGLESQVIKSTVVISLIMTTVVALVTFVFLKFF